MNITIKRTKSHGEYTHGQLSIDGTRICDTLENSNAQIPAGNYTIRLAKCKQHARKMPLIFPHPSTLNPHPLCDRCPKSLNPNPSSLNLTLPCYCPMLKAGNGVHNRLDGSIIVGKYNCRGSIIHSKTTFDPLYERIRKSVSRGNEVTVNIKDVPSTLNPHPSTKIFV